MTSPTLVAEATKRSGVVWVGGRLVWHVWHDGAMYVVAGGPEQPAPAQPGEQALVTVRSRGTQSGRVVEWRADVTRVEPGSELWDEVVPVLAAERLNAPRGHAGRWASESVVLRFTPLL